MALPVLAGGDVRAELEQVAAILARAERRGASRERVEGAHLVVGGAQGQRLPRRGERLGLPHAEIGPVGDALLDRQGVDVELAPLGPAREEGIPPLVAAGRRVVSRQSDPGEGNGRLRRDVEDAADQRRAGPGADRGVRVLRARLDRQLGADGPALPDLSREPAAERVEAPVGVGRLPRVAGLGLVEVVRLDGGLLDLLAGVVGAERLLVPLDQRLFLVVEHGQVEIAVGIRDADELDPRLAERVGRVQSVEVRGAGAVERGAVEQQIPVAAHQVLAADPRRPAPARLHVEVEALEDHLVPLERRVGREHLLALVVEHRHQLDLRAEGEAAPELRAKAELVHHVGGVVVEVLEVVPVLAAEPLLEADLDPVAGRRFVGGARRGRARGERGQEDENADTRDVDAGCGSHAGSLFRGGSARQGPGGRATNSGARGAETPREEAGCPRPPGRRAARDRRRGA